MGNEASTIGDGGGKAKHRRWLPGCCRSRAVHDAGAVGMRKWSRAQVRTWLEVFDGGTFASSVPHDKVYKSLDGPTMSDSPMRLIREAYEDPDIVAQYQFAVNYWRHFLTLNADMYRGLKTTFPPEAVLAAMRTATLDCAHLTSQFSVTEKDVNDTFFLHERSHGGKVPINEHGRLDEAGWLWSMVVNREAPAMPTTLADAFSYRLDTGSSEALLAVAPPGAGKTFGAWQLGMSRYVDYLDANPANIVSVFSKLKQEIIRKDFDDKLLLQPGETVDTVPDTKLNSRKALYHTWILLHALATMRGQCKSPGDWLFLQLFRPDHVLQGYRAAVRVWRRNVLPYAALKLIDSARDAKGHASGRAVLVLDEASHALPDNNQPRFARLRDATPQTLPAATPRDATGRPSLDPSSGLYVGVNRLLSGASTVAAAVGVGVGAGAGRERATNLPNASATGDQGETSQTGLLGCLLQAAMVYKTRMIVMGTSFSFTHAQDLVWSGCDHPGSMRSVRPQDIVSYMKSADFPQLSATECGDCIRFYANLLNIELDNSLLTVCQQLQGRPMLAHYFITHFIRKPTPMANPRGSWAGV